MIEIIRRKKILQKLINMIVIKSPKIIDLKKSIGDHDLEISLMIERDMDLEIDMMIERDMDQETSMMKE